GSVMCFFFQAEDGIRDFHVTGVQTCALPIFNLDILERHQAELVMSESLLRSIHEPNVRNRLNRLAHGNPALTRFEFQYTFPPARSEERRVGKACRARWSPKRRTRRVASSTVV